ncbi:hypothetical protein [Puniceicoccus vermicola]|uniref:Uncharacterized protein n=1 Tax=Puniceicoccus vermicola TaxID=388746 RepID=A0A7X1E583_9BACT|nr:hypothetical protein [Puniceicoccus vermicola]MBC2602854.1 hypothetical protein [Puniceicoccus vermicola]
MSKNFYKFSFCFFALSSIIRLDAQSVEEPAKAKFSTLAWDQTIKGLYYWDDEERINLNIPNGAPSPTFEAPIDKPLVFYRDTGQIDEAGNPIGNPLVSINIDRADDPLLLIFFKRNDQTDSYYIAPIVNETQTTPEEIYQLYNISSHDIVAKFNDQKIALEPNKPLIIPAPGTDQASFGVMMAIQMDSQENGEWQLVYKAFWPYRQGRSSLVFISDQEGRKNQIKVRRFYVPTREL